MKTRVFLTTLLTVCVSFFVVGCGDDDDEAESPNPAPPPIDGDDRVLTAANKIYTAYITDQNEPITLTFPAAGEYRMVQAEVIETGTISGVTREVNRWTLNVTPAAGSPPGAQQGVLHLDFTAENAGNWTFAPEVGTAEIGTFTVSTFGPDDPDPGGPPDRTTLSGKTLQINYPGGGGERFQFIDGSNVSYENGAQTGSYTWDQANARVNVTLNNGFLFEITIPEGSSQGTVVFRHDANANPETDTGTYTLQ